MIVDDEALSRRAVRQLLARHLDIEVVAECADGATASQWLGEAAVDVVFLDVRTQGSSGLDLIRREREVHRVGRPLVVFISAFDESAVLAFEVEAVDFLRKPIMPQRFDATIDRLRRRLRLREPAGQGHLERLVVREQRRDTVIMVGEIDYFEADDVYVALHVRGKRRLVRTTLDTLGAQLDPRSFARIHRSYIVPFDKAVVLHRTGVIWQVQLSCGALLPVSRRRRGALRGLFRSRGLMAVDARGDHARPRRLVGPPMASGTPRNAEP